MRMQERGISSSFDEETRTMSIRFSKKRSVDSDIQDNIVIDFDGDGNIVNLDILDIKLSDFKKIEPAYATEKNQSTTRRTSRAR